MKLITLRSTPDGNENGKIIEVVIDHDPTNFKSSYVRVVRLKYGTIQVTNQPCRISDKKLDAVSNHRYVHGS
ncbi:hypothetical protein AB835_05635 [Candidatus Endobugula sertula]|uniref:Uncharacterized protein n=1 Tax=Candidatus Endobugula sertula TaxID=62101 RepID=A0A1D2QQZ7_9GAMM|nr:hypothetical protein AB835_05635 [Candidatus Endobugula sertula]